MLNEVTPDAAKNRTTAQETTGDDSELTITTKGSPRLGLARIASSCCCPCCSCCCSNDTF